MTISIFFQKKSSAKNQTYNKITVCLHILVNENRYIQEQKLTTKKE